MQGTLQGWRYLRKQLSGHLQDEGNNCGGILDRAYLLKATDENLLEFRTQKRMDPHLIASSSAPRCIQCGQYLISLTSVSSVTLLVLRIRQSSDTFYLFPLDVFLFYISGLVLLVKLVSTTKHVASSFWALLNVCM